MATVQRRIVHKQFNSPIALYSDTNVKDTLDRELRQLGNGVIGINFDDPSTTRPGSLAKSAVLAALEEEEKNRAGAKPGLKRVAWPPQEGSFYATEPVEYQQAAVEPQQQQIQPQYQAISQQQQSQPIRNQQVAHSASNNSVQNYSTAPSTKPSIPVIPAQQIPHQQLQRPVSIHGFSAFQNQQPLPPLPKLQTNFTTPQNNQQTSCHGSSPRGWSHVDSPRSPSVTQKQFCSNASAMPPFDVAAPSSTMFQLGNSQAQIVSQVSTPQQQIYQQPQQQFYQQPQQQFYQQPPQQYHQQQQQQQHQPFMGTPLRKEAPISQRPAPVYQSQPVAATFQGGANMRGDLKWPPAEYKQSDVDNAERRKVALGPAFRPKRMNKDYTGFFAQNALSNTYPGYRVPPGTLHVGNDH